MPDKDWATKLMIMGWDLFALRYNDIAFVIDLFHLRKWRKLMWTKVEGTNILEVGVGTGINFAYYPAGDEITAIDFSEQMLKRAKKKANKQNLKVNLQLMDVQQLDFADNTFDTVVGTLVLLVVPKPVQGIIEVQRVCKPGGKVIFLEANAIPLLRWRLKIINPLIVRTFGVDAARGPLNTVAESDLTVEKVTSIWPGLFKLIEARKKIPPQCSARRHEATGI